MAGLKTLAKELQSKGRYGDTILAHINPQEAGILKALGGAGTRNPDTGLPEYWGGLGALNPFNPGSAAGKAVGSIPGVKQVQDVATKITQPFEKAIVQPVSRGLADFDKQVAKTIPGGWGTVGQVALSMIPGAQPLAIGLGAARGAGLLRTGSSLQKANLQGAIIGGATAYATSELGEYMRGAVPPGSESGPSYLPESSYDVIPKVIPAEGGDVYLNSQGQMVSGLPADVPGGVVTGPALNVPPPSTLQGPLVSDAVSGYDVGAPLPSPQPSITSNIMKGNFGDAMSQVGTKLSDAGVKTLQNVQDFGKTAIDPSTYTEGIPKILEKGYEGVGDTLSGAKNLLGAGEMTSKEAAKLAAKTGVDPMKMGALAIYGETNLAGLEEQRKYLEEAKKANAISQAEYDAALGEINRQRDYAADVVSKSPFNPNPSRDVSIGETFYGRSGEGENLYEKTPFARYAVGGGVMGPDSPDDQTGMPNYSPIEKLGLGGMPGYAEGGTPRFLSGGGDGMSDSIKATINEKQPARLADGEFVIPADVVSHLGNGSSKAGAKQLYSMMDRVRSARTGRKSQGKQINPRKYMTA